MQAIIRTNNFNFIKPPVKTGIPAQDIEHKGARILSELRPVCNVILHSGGTWEVVLITAFKVAAAPGADGLVRATVWTVFVNLSGKLAEKTESARVRPDAVDLWID